VIVIVLLIGGVVAYTYMASPVKTSNNTSVISNSSNVTATTSNKTANIKIVASQSGPASAVQGNNVTIKYSVSNTGGQIVYNVKATSQDFDTTIGTLKPGETKNFQYTLHIPTDKEVQEDFGPNATVSNPFFIGGFGVSYTDSSGSTHTINANSIEIKL
jgi:cytoskeletal protein RodZ